MRVPVGASAMLTSVIFCVSGGIEALGDPGDAEDDGTAGDAPAPSGSAVATPLGTTAGEDVAAVGSPVGDGLGGTGVGGAGVFFGNGGGVCSLVTATWTDDGVEAGVAARS